MNGNERYKVEGLVIGTRRDGKNRYDELARRRLVELCEAPGVSLTAIAVTNGLNPNVVRRWVGLAKDPARARPGALLPVVLLNEAAPGIEREAEGEKAAGIERGASDLAGVEFRIDLRDATVRFTGPLSAATLRLIREGVGSR